MSTTSAPTTTLTVYVALAVFNFIGSIIQGVAGIGDAIFLQVLWYMACVADSEQFTNTPLGPDPIAAVALLMYIRLLFMAPLVVYLGLNDSIFSKSMTIMMAVPSTILSIIGVVLFKYLDGKGDVLKLVLGVSSLAFAIMYAFILVFRTFSKKKHVEALKEKNVKLVVEADAIESEAHMDMNTSFNSLQASFVNHVPNTSILIMQPPAHFRSNTGSFTGSPIGGTPNVVQPSNTFDTIPVEASEPPIDHETGLPVGTTEAFVSTITGEPFIATEAAVPQPTEENVPPLTPSKLSPSRTMTYTRVRINRNLDANGKIKQSTKIGAAVAASAAGLMASLTGVNAPPQIIFILLYDAPNYIVRVNFSAQSIPSGVIRFFMAIGLKKFTSAQIPIFIVTIIFGYAGVFAGNSIGRLLGPTSFNIFVLCLLLLSSLVMVITSVALLAFFTLATVLITAGVAVWENKKNKPIIEKQTEAEMEIEKRMYDVMEELQRNNTSFFPSSSVDEQMYRRRQAAQHPQPMWVNFDNDDDAVHHERRASFLSGSGRGAAADDTAQVGGGGGGGILKKSPFGEPSAALGGFASANANSTSAMSGAEGASLRTPLENSPHVSSPGTATSARHAHFEDETEPNTGAVAAAATTDDATERDAQTQAHLVGDDADSLADSVTDSHRVQIASNEEKRADGEDEDSLL